MEEIKIEKGIPIPPTYHSGNKFPLRQMEIGDSILVKDNRERSTCTTQSKRYGIKITSRKLPGGGVRIWRIK